MRKTFISTDGIERPNIRYRKCHALLREERPGAVLDVGCSIGYMGHYLAGENVRVFGIDISTRFAAVANRNGTACLVGDVSKGLPFQGGMFDCLFAGEIIEHLEDTDLFLEECRRVLKAGGALIVTTPNLVSLENRIRMLFGYYPLFADYRMSEDNHKRAYTPRALSSQLREHHFTVETLTGSYIPLPFSSVSHRISRISGNSLLRGLGTILPGLAVHVIVKARKPIHPPAAQR